MFRPDNARVNARISRLVLSYTADTAVDDYTLVFTVPKEFMASSSTGELPEIPATGGDPAVPAEATFYLGTDSAKAGYVRPDSGGAVPSVATPIAVADPTEANRFVRTPITDALADIFTDDVDGFVAANVGAVITWSNIKLDKDETFKTYIDKVTVAEAGAGLTFYGAAGMDTAPNPTVFTTTGQHAKFYIVNPENEGIIFSSNASTPAAASLQTITFTFTADTTPIKDGKVQFTIPSGWSTPNKPTDAAADVLGRITVEGSGTEYADLSRSGRSVTVNIDEMAVDDSVTVTYGGADMKALVQNTAGTVKINGYYWASSGSPRRGAGTVEIEVTNVGDGTGEATISPTSAKAGSIDQAFTIVYDAAGTMDGGAVSLKPPSNWGEFETDPAKLNYVSVRASGGATIEETDNGRTIIIVILGKCPPSGKVTFTYGGGTGARRGARVQDGTDVATFTIESRGDEFGRLELVTGTRAKAAVTENDPKYLGESLQRRDGCGSSRCNRCRRR